MIMIAILIIQFMNFNSRILYIEACSSRSTPKPRLPTPTPRPNVTFHTYACPPTYATWYCLNNATCFTVKIGESLLYNCECPDGYMGQRCEFKDLDGSYLPARKQVMFQTAGITSGATVAVFLVVIVCLSVYVHCQRKKKQSRAATCCVDGRGPMDFEHRKVPFARRPSNRREDFSLTRITTECKPTELSTSICMTGKGDLMSPKQYQVLPIPHTSHHHQYETPIANVSQSSHILSGSGRVQYHHHLSSGKLPPPPAPALIV